MIKVLDMRFIRYANLFSRVTRIKTKHCFEYNNMIVFVVPRKFVMEAIGRNNINLERLSQIIGRKIKVVAEPNGRGDIRNFVSIIVRPVKFNSIEIKGDEVIINAGMQSKASLIGRNKKRLEEMENILGQYFGIRKLRVK